MGQAVAELQDVGCHQGVGHQLGEDQLLDVGYLQDVARQPGVGCRQGAARHLGEVQQHCEAASGCRGEAKVSVCDSACRGWREVLDRDASAL